MSKSLVFLKELFLQDRDGYSSKILSVRGAEEGLVHVEIITQSRKEKEAGVKTIHRVFSTEALA